MGVPFSKFRFTTVTATPLPRQRELLRWGTPTLNKLTIWLSLSKTSNLSEMILIWTSSKTKHKNAIILLLTFPFQYFTYFAPVGHQRSCLPIKMKIERPGERRKIILLEHLIKMWWTIEYFANRKPNPCLVWWYYNKAWSGGIITRQT